MTEKQNKLDRKYTHSEFLKEFFPNVDPNEIKENGEMLLTEEQFFNILTQVSAPIQETSVKEKK